MAVSKTEKRKKVMVKKIFFQNKAPLRKINKIKNDFSNIHDQIFDLDFVR